MHNEMFQISRFVIQKEILFCMLLYFYALVYLHKGQGNKKTIWIFTGTFHQV